MVKISSCDSDAEKVKQNYRTEEKSVGAAEGEAALIIATVTNTNVSKHNTSGWNSCGGARHHLQLRTGFSVEYFVPGLLGSSLSAGTCGAGV